MTTMPSATRPRIGIIGTLNTRRLAGAILFVLLFAMAVRIPTDTDTWWHLRTGNWMAANGQIPLTDPFSHTRLNTPWIDHSWGAQVIMTAAYNLFGGPEGAGVWGLALYTAALATAGMAFAFLMSDGDVFIRAFVIVFGAAAAAVFWSARPQMMSFAFSGALLYLLHLYKRQKVDRLWLIPVFMVFWVNLHGGFSIGFILIGGFLIGEVLGRLFDSKNPAVLSWAALGRLVVFTVIAAVVLVLNPNTTQMWGYPFRTFGIGALQDFIQEWASPNFHGRETWGFLILLLGTITALGVSGKRAEWSDLTLLCGTCFMALYAGRNVSTFALVATPILARHGTAWLADHGWRMTRPRPARRGMLLLNWLLLALVCLGAGLKIAATLLPAGVEAATRAVLPVEAADFLRRAKPEGVLFNSYNWGGYLMFAAPEYPVFVDGRTDLYDDAFLREWLKAAQGQGWEATFAKYGITLAVIERDSLLAEALRRTEGWQEIHSDPLTAIFQRTP